MTVLVWYDVENVRHRIKRGETFIVQRILIAGKMVELAGPLTLRYSDRIHISPILDEHYDAEASSHLASEQTVPDGAGLPLPSQGDALRLQLRLSMPVPLEEPWNNHP